MPRRVMMPVEQAHAREYAINWPPPRVAKSRIMRDLHNKYREEAENRGLSYYARTAFTRYLYAAMGKVQVDAVPPIIWPPLVAIPEPEHKVGDVLKFTEVGGPLTFEYEKVETPPTLLLPLRAHQQTLVAAQLRLEEEGVIHIENDRYVEVSASRISEPFGSGKTIAVIAIILLRQTPPLRPTWYRPYQVSGGVRDGMTISMPFMVKTVWGPNALLRPNLVFAEASVLLQWKNTLTTFAPSLRVLVIEKVFQLRKLKGYLDEGTLNDMYDIVIAKNGIITGSCEIDDPEESNQGKQRKIVAMIANMTRDKVWSRVIYDDYDMNKRHRTNCVVNALFTIFISATQSLKSIPMRVNVEYQSLYDLLLNQRMDVSALMKNSKVFGTEVNITNEKSFTDESTNVGKPEFRVYRIVNNRRQVADLIGALNLENPEHAAAILEAVRGDAIGAAAKIAGVEANSIEDLFKQMLAHQYEAFRKATVTIGWIDALDRDEFPSLPEPPASEEPYHQKHVYDQRPIDYKYPDIAGKVERVELECKETRIKSGGAIERMKSSLAEGECAVCCAELSGDDAVIVKCCSKILCADCSIKATRMQAGRGSCPNCRQPTSIGNMVFIGKAINISDILDEGKVEEALEGGMKALTINDAEEKKDGGVVEEIDPRNLSKIATLKHIINRNRVKHTVVDMKIPGLLMGTRELPEPTAAATKPLVFSKFDEGLDDIEDQLKKEGIKYIRMRGSAAELHATAEKFNNSTDACVLLINGEQYAAGINLQTATDLVFMHKILDPAIEAQIIGRLQRIGRTFKGIIHYLLYEEE